MNFIWLGAVVLLLAAGGGFGWRWYTRRENAPRPSNGALDALDTVAAWEPQATRILTSPERLAYATLLRALPDHLILAQVPLSRFLRVPTRYSYAEWLARVGQLCADLVVCDASSQVLAVVEVRPTGQSDRGRKRFDRMGRVLKAAGVPLHVWSEQALPSVTAAREMLTPEPKAAQKAEGAAPAQPSAGKPASPQQPPAVHRPAVQPSASALAAHGLARGIKDEIGVIPVSANGAELRDPPPSTWFDDLDVRPAPMKKPTH
jgi:hypothetical protein